MDEEEYDRLWEEWKCHGCGEPLADEDIISHNESRGEFWGEPCSERVPDGYQCSKCGHREML